MEFPEAILFDLDGVLLDTEPLLANAWRETAKEYNYYLSKNQLQKLSKSMAPLKGFVFVSC